MNIEDVYVGMRFIVSKPGLPAGSVAGRIYAVSRIDYSSGVVGAADLPYGAWAWQIERAPAAPPSEAKFFIVWNPLSDKPPRMRHATRAQAEESATTLARKFGEPFYVCEASALFERAEVTRKDLK